MDSDLVLETLNSIYKNAMMINPKENFRIEMIKAI